MAVLQDMRYHGVRLLSFAFVWLTLQSSAASIQGDITLDENWEALVYLSAINSFADLNTASYEFLIAEARLDSLGHFEIGEVNLPAGDRIYRLHICKKNDPISTIIIGGNDENFIHFIMNMQSQIQVTTNTMKPAFQYSIVSGHQANKQFGLLVHLQKDLLMPPHLPSEQNRAFLREQVLGTFSALADTSSYSIIRLMALYLINQSFEPPIELMEKTRDEMDTSDTSSPYYQSFINQLGYLTYQSGPSQASLFNRLKWIAIFMTLLFIAAGIWWRSRPKKVRASNPSPELLQLSVQEKRVFEMLREGASNKDISAALNIEVSTVKSHVYKIFSRLGVKSRKEILNRDW